MSKYSFDFKVKVVSEYLENHDSMSGLSKKYKISISIIHKWIHQAEQNGLSSLQVKHSKRVYSPDFKIDVVRYYLNNPNLGEVPVATKFNIHASQVFSWVKKFEHEGIAGLMPKQKGRPSRMSKKTSKKQTQKIELSERQKYEEELLKKDAEIERLRLENIVLKKVAARYPRYPINEKH